MERRELFSSLASRFSKEQETKKSLIRPPYFEKESDFLDKCVECEGFCVSSCEEKIIKIAEDKTPYIDFSVSGCTYCDECAKVCEYDVLKLENKKNIEQTIEIDMLRCVSWHDTMCFSCKDPCLDDAIDFLAMFRPSINSDKCTNCGFCIKYCPVDAIAIKETNGSRV